MTRKKGPFREIPHVKGSEILNGKSADEAFTLIELLVVVAIIMILIAIAMPHYQDALIRAKTATVKAEHRTLATALETYYSDHRVYPEDYAESRIVGPHGFGRLTTPVAYLREIPPDAFGGYTDPERGNHVLSYTLGSSPNDKPQVWMLTSSGPNLLDDTIPAFDYPGYSPFLFENPNSGFYYTRYTPTNGTKSVGDIIRVGDGNVD